MWNWIVLVLLIAVGLFDLHLYFSDKLTISQRVHRMFPRWVDCGIIVVLLALIWWLGGGPKAFVPVMVGVIIGHLFWQE